MGVMMVLVAHVQVAAGLAERPATEVKPGRLDEALLDGHPQAEIGPGGIAHGGEAADDLPRGLMAEWAQLRKIDAMRAHSAPSTSLLRPFSSSWNRVRLACR